ncbi:hypothetical protein D3C76_1427130 [compost metagenome]
MRAPLQGFHLDVQAGGLGHGLAQHAHVEHLLITFVDDHLDRLAVVTGLLQQALGLLRVVLVALFRRGVVEGAGLRNRRVVGLGQAVGQGSDHLPVIQRMGDGLADAHVLEQGVVGLEQQAADRHDRAD